MSNKATLRGNIWARRAYLRLMTELGGRCAQCATLEDLTFDCIQPQGDKHHRGGTKKRIQFYRKQHYQSGNIQILCAKCNAKKGDNQQPF